MPSSEPIISRDPFGGYADWMVPLMLGTQTLQNVGAALRPSEIKPANPLEGFLGISLIGQREESVRQRDEAIRNARWLRLSQAAELAANNAQVGEASRLGKVISTEFGSGAGDIYGQIAQQNLMLRQGVLPGMYPRGSTSLPTPPAEAAPPIQYVSQGQVIPPQATAEPTQPSQVSQLRAGGSISFGPGGTTISSQLEPYGSKEATATILAQAQQQQLRPSQVRAQMAVLSQQTAGSSVPFVPDETQLQAYEGRYFSRNVKDRTNLFMQAGVSQAEALQQAARLSLQELGYLPPGWQGFVQPSDAEITNAASQRAVATAGTVMKLLMQSTVQSGGGPGSIPQNILGIAIDQDPYLSPAQRNGLKEQMAVQFAESLIPHLQQGGLSRELAEQRARQYASAAVGGMVPTVWKQQGVSTVLTPEQFQLYTANPEAYSPYTPEGVRKLQGAGVELSEAKKLTEPSIAVEAQKQILAGPQPQAGALPKAPGPAPLAKATEEQFQVGKRRGAEKLATEEEVRLAHRIAPEADLKNAQGLDAIYTNATRLLQLQPQIEAKYGSIPGGFIGLMNTMQRGVGARDPLLRQYVNLVQETFNLKKKEFAGTAVSARERTDLSDYIPDESMNVREVFGLMKNLRTSSGIMLERDLGVLKDNYPRTNINSLFFVREREASKRRGAPK